MSAAGVAVPCAAFTRADGYERRRPEETLLHQLVSEHWPAFLERAEESGGLPRFVVRDFEEYLRCGILEHGFVQLACRHCGHEMLVAFSCKRRGFCPSCLGRRMNDIAAHLVDEVLPEVRIRQWVCSLPWSLRHALAYDRALCAHVLDAFISALTRSLRRRAKRQLGLRSVERALVGGLTVIQRNDGALRVNPHFHTLMLDGVYVRGEDGTLSFHALSEPSGEDVAQVAASTHAAIVRVLERHGRSLEGASDAHDAMALEQPVLASCYGASASDVQLLIARSAGTTPAYLHWLGSSWATVSGNGANAIWGITATDIWGIADYNIVHWNGSTWSTALNRPTTSPRLNGVWGSSASDVWAVGSGVILHWNGSAWTTVTTHAPYLYGIWGSSATDVWAVGGGGAILRYRP